ncbi:MAG: glycosyl hydrolase-related protein [Oliverpabstia sp.]
MDCKKIIIVFKTHFDIGFTDLAKNVLESYSKELMPGVISTCRAARELNPDYPYVWTMSSWPLKVVLESEQTEKEVLQEAEKLIESDELVWHMLPYTTHTEFCGVEEYIRGMYSSKELCEKYGKHFISAKMTDVPGHTRTLPAILKKAGVEFLHLGCNPGCMPPDVPRLFWWESCDKSRVLTFYNKGGYGSGILPPKDWDFPVWLAVMQTNDNLGPHKPEAIAEVIRQAKTVYPDAEIVIGSLDDFYKELTQYSLDNVPVVDKDLADTWIHGVGAYPKEVSSLRDTRQLTDEIQKLTALYTGEGEEEAAKCYEQNLLFGEHTWGLDVKITLGNNRFYEKKEFLEHLSDEPCRRMEESWEEQRDRERESTKRMKYLAEAQANALASQVQMEVPHVTVFTGLGFDRNAWVMLPEEVPEQECMYLKDPETGKCYPVIRDNGVRKAWIQDIPAMGYLSLEICAGDCSLERKERTVFDSKNKVLENRFFRLCFDPQYGTITSLVDKRTGKEWADKENGGLCQYQYDVYGIEDITEYIRNYTYRFFDWLVNDLGKMAYPEQKHLTFCPEHAEFTSEELEYGTKVTITCRNSEESWQAYGNSPEIIVEVMLYDQEDAVDITVKMPDKQKTPFTESGHVIFPFAAEHARITMNKMGQMIDCTEDIVKDGNHAIYCCENWMDVTSGDDCVTLICKDSPLNSIGESGIYKFRSDYQEHRPSIYNNMFNNMWGTNFPQWIEGNLEYHYRLVFGKKTTAEKNRCSHSFTSPVPVGFSDGTSAKKRLPACDAWVKIDGDMRILTVKTAENKEGMILRIMDISGERKQAALKFAKTYHEIWECSTLEEKQKLLVQDGDSLEIVSEPYEIRTFLLK